MTPGSLRRRARFIALALGIALACVPIPQSLSTFAPTNACPEHPCAAYGQDGGLACTGGVCLEAQPPPPSHLTLLVAMPAGAHRAPGLTFSLAFPNDATDSGAPAPVFLLPTKNTGRYLVTPDIAGFVQGDIGGNIMTTALPVHVTYRSLWLPGSASPSVPADAGVSLSDTAALGLAVYPMAVDAVQGTGTYPGPSLGPDAIFAAYVQRDATYERTIAPEPPFDQTFPPDVNRVSFRQMAVEDPTDLVTLDHTNKTQVALDFPRFDLSRADGQSLNGWTAYLRDATTKRPLSPIKALSGTRTPDGGVLLPTSHHPQAVGTSAPDALANAELVVAPPAAQHLPMEILRGEPQLPRAEIYPLVPHWVTVAGRVSSDGNPVLAEVVFEAMGIYAFSPTRTTDPNDAGSSADGGDAGPAYPLQLQGFEYVSRARAQPDASGESVYSIELPPGEYRISARPLDGALALADGGPPLPGDGGTPSPADGGLPSPYGLTVREKFNTGLTDDLGADIAIQPASTLSGAAVIADQRPLAGATVEALPVHCAPPTGSDAGMPPNDSPACMPRYRQTTTDPGGTFALALDQGEYVVRVEPADGTRLPWVAQMLSLPAPGPIGVQIPAPIHRALQLFDQDGVAVANAIVRMFTMPASGPAIEVGRAITDATGRFDMYIDPSVQ